MVLPDTARTNDAGHLEIGGLDVADLAANEGTPLFVLDDVTIRSRCREYIQIFDNCGLQSEVIYAGKAFLSRAFLAILLEEGLSLDVSSGGELYLALQSGFPPEKMFFHGNNKTPVELRMAVENGVGRIVADSLEELSRLSGLAAETGARIQIMLRITPGVEVSTHRYVRTGQVDSKFGFGLAGGAARQAVARALEDPRLDLTGFHFHLGSQIVAVGSYAEAVRIVVRWAAEVKKELGYELRELNVGGGLAIAYEEGDEKPSVADFAATVANGVQEETTRRDLKAPRIMVEPGRSIIGNAGVTLYAVGTVKRIPGLRTYVSVDGGMSDNLRPMLYKSRYAAVLANRMKDEASETVTVVGKHCESGDVLVKDCRMPPPRAGDILCTPATGAYGYVMANNYNRQPRPAVALVSSGESRIIIRRETYADLMRLEQG